MYGPQGNSWFCFSESPDARTRGKTKLTEFPEGQYIKCVAIYLDFPLNNHIAITKK